MHKKRKMHIVQPIGTISGSAISRIAITLAEEFARAGHRSTLVVWNRSKLEREIDPKVEIIETRIIGLSRRSLATKLFRALFKPLLGTRLFLVVFAWFISGQLQRQVLNKSDYDIALLHAHSVFHLRKITLPYLVVAHNTKSRQLLDSRFAWVNKMLKQIYIRVYQGKRIACVSEGIRQDFINNFGLAAERLTTLHNPFDLASIRDQAAELPASQLHDKPFIVSLGRNDPQKRFDRLLRAYSLAEISEDLLILGRAAENKALRQQVKALGLEHKVHFPGFIDNPFPYVKAAQLLVISSDYEGLPSTLIEALICGTPVVSTDCPSGPREVLTGELARYLVPLDDGQALASKIRDAIAAPYPIHEPMVSVFDRQVIGHRYLEQLERTLGWPAHVVEPSQ